MRACSAHYNGLMTVQKSEKSKGRPHAGAKDKMRGEGSNELEGAKKDERRMGGQEGASEQMRAVKAANEQRPSAASFPRTIINRRES